MSRKVYVEVKTRLIIDQDDGVETSEIIENMEYEFVSTDNRADIVDTEITEWEVTDSK